jgi:DnaK suppressor protein
MVNIRSIIKNMARKLSQNTINKFKKRLEAEREQLLSILEQHQQERENIRLSEASAERSPDPSSADGGSMAFELEKELTLDENTRHLLNQIEHALVLIKKKKYGNCENCGEPIPVARLEALPYATMRKECAEALES